MTNVKAIRDFLSDDEWKIIDYALSEYLDHDEDAYACRELLHKIGTIFEEIHK